MQPHGMFDEIAVTRSDSDTTLLRVDSTISDVAEIQVDDLCRRNLSKAGRVWGKYDIYEI